LDYNSVSSLVLVLVFDGLQARLKFIFFHFFHDNEEGPEITAANKKGLEITSYPPNLENQQLPLKPKPLLQNQLSKRTHSC